MGRPKKKLLDMDRIAAALGAVRRGKAKPSMDMGKVAAALRRGVALRKRRQAMGKKYLQMWELYCIMGILGAIALLAIVIRGLLLLCL